MKKENKLRRRTILSGICAALPVAVAGCTSQANSGNTPATDSDDKCSETTVTFEKLDLTEPERPSNITEESTKDYVFSLEKEIQRQQHGEEFTGLDKDSPIYTEERENGIGVQFSAWLKLTRDGRSIDLFYNVQYIVSDNGVWRLEKDHANPETQTIATRPSFERLLCW